MWAASRATGSTTSTPIFVDSNGSLFVGSDVPGQYMLQSIPGRPSFFANYHSVPSTTASSSTGSPAQVPTSTTTATSTTSSTGGDNSGIRSLMVPVGAQSIIHQSAITSNAIQLGAPMSTGTPGVNGAPATGGISEAWSWETKHYHELHLDF